MESPEGMAPLVTRLKVMLEQLPPPPVKASDDPDVRMRYNRLVNKAEKLCSTDFSEFIAGEELVMSKSMLLFGENVGALKNLVLNLTAFRSILADFITNLEAMYPVSSPESMDPMISAPVSIALGNNGHVVISHAGRDSNQHVSYDIRPGDTPTLLAALRDLRINAEYTAALEAALAESDNTQNSALSWFGAFISDIGSGTISGSLVALLPTIATLVSAYAAGIR